MTLKIKIKIKIISRQAPPLLLQIKNKKASQRAIREVRKVSDPGQRIAVAENLLYWAITAQLYELERRPELLQRAKNRIKVHIQGLLARATRMIDSYPDYQVTRDYHDSSHRAFLDWQASVSE